MKQPTHSLQEMTREALLHVPQATTHELVLIGCDGCHRNPSLLPMMSEIVSVQRPSNTCLMELPPLIWGKGNTARARLQAAERSLAVSGCEENCTAKLLEPLSPPDIKLTLNPMSPLQEQQRQVLEHIDQWTQEKEPASPNQQPFAAKVSRRRFQTPPSEETTPTICHGPEVETPVVQPQKHFFVQEPPSASPQSQQSAYFTRQPGPKKSMWKWLSFLTVLGVVLYGMNPFTNRSDEPSKERATAPGSLSAANALPKKTSLKRLPAPERKRTRSQKKPVQRRKLKQPKKETRPPERRSEPSTLLPQARAPKPTLSAEQTKRARRTQKSNQNWIGGVCKRASHCKFAEGMCLLQVPGGMCTQFCNKYCPDKRGNSYTSSYCVELFRVRKYLPSLPARSGGLCLSQCNYKLFPQTGCRTGTICQTLPLQRNSRITRQLCMPIGQ